MLLALTYYQFCNLQVVDHGLQTSYLRVEIYLTELKLAKYPEVDEHATKKRKFSKRDTLG